MNQAQLDRIARIDFLAEKGRQDKIDEIKAKSKKENANFYSCNRNWTLNEMDMHL